MLYYYRISVSKEISINKTSASKECDVFQYRVRGKEFKFYPDVFNVCHDVLIIPMNLSYPVSLYFNGANFCYIISKIEVINLLKNFDLTEKKGI